jgi:hypothetical protein
MKIQDELKKEVIDYIDNLNKSTEDLKLTFFQKREKLIKLRDKYIFKDIGYNEFKYDVNEINSIKEQIKFLIEFWNEK